MPFSFDTPDDTENQDISSSGSSKKEPVKTKTVVMTYGGFNPPALSHQFILELMSKVAEYEKGDWRVYLTPEQNRIDAPLDRKTRLVYLRKAFPKASDHFDDNSDLEKMTDALKDLYDQGYTKLRVVTEPGRANDYEALVRKYNNNPDDHGNVLYAFEEIQIITTGVLSADGEELRQYSPSQLLAYARAQDQDSFERGLPAGMSSADMKDLYNAVQQGLSGKQLDEQHVKELLDKPNKFRVDSVGPGHYTFEFRAGKNQYVGDLENQPMIPAVASALPPEVAHLAKTPVWSLNFYEWDQMSQDILDTQNAFEVFSTVAQVLRKFVVKKAPEALWFSAKESSRKRLYATFARRFTQEYPEYTVFEVPYEDRTAFLLVRRASIR